MYVRDLHNNVLTNFKPLEKIFMENEIMEKYVINGLIIRKIDLFKAYGIIESDIRNNNALSLHKIG